MTSLAAVSLRAGLPSLGSVTRVSNAAVPAGAAVSFRIDYAEGDDPVSYVALTLADVSGATRTVGSGEPVPGLTLSLPSSSSWLSGDYVVSRVALVDRAGRVTLYQAGGTLVAEPFLAGSPDRHSADLGAAGFTLSGGAAASAPPALTSLARSMAARVDAGDRVAFTVGYADGGEPLEAVEVTLVDEAGTRRVLRSSAPAPGSVVEIRSGPSWLEGNHAVAEVALLGRSGQATRYARAGVVIHVPARPGAPAVHGIDLSAQDFSVVGGASTSAVPTLVAVTRSFPPLLAAAGAGSFTVGYAPGSEPVRSIALTLVDPAGNPRTLVTGAGVGGEAVLTLPAASAWPAGDYRVAEVSFVDQAGRVVRYGRGGSVAVLPSPRVPLAAAAVDLAAHDFRLAGAGEPAGAIVAEAVPAAEAAPSASGARLVSVLLTTPLAAGESLNVGFMLEGTGRGMFRPMLLRAVGSSLSALGISGAHSAPRLELSEDGGVVAANEGWGGTSALRQAFARVGAFPLATDDSADAALLAAVPAGRVQSVRVSGAEGASGRVLLELHEDAAPAGAPRMVGLSTLHRAGPAFTAGFSVAGEGRATVVIRAVGPGLAALGVTDGLADPVLTLVGSGNVNLRRNDDWEAGDAAAMVAAGLTALPRGSLDAAVVQSLTAGAYTVRIDGPGGQPGRVLLEIHEVPAAASGR